MMYRELPPPPELAPWVEALWDFSIDERAGEVRHVIPPTGGASLTHVPQRGWVIVGPSIPPRVVSVHGGEVFRGVHFWPGAARSLLRIASPLRDLMAPLASLLRDRPGPPDVGAATPFFRALERWLVARVPEAEPLDPAVMTAALRVVRGRGNETILALARGVSLSPRQLRRRFAATVELSPKELSCVRRLRGSAVAALCSRRSWVDLAAEAGYADQAHLVREYRRLLGLSPRRFLAHAGRIDHRLLTHGPAPPG